MSETSDPNDLIWRNAQLKLLEHSIPDSRFHNDCSCFIPDFRGSSAAIDRVIQLPCYKTSRTILFTPDNSVQELRLRALKDGKKLLVATQDLRRGFVVLDPQRIPEDQFELASNVGGMERPGMGRYVTLAQLQDEGLKLDLFVMGSWVVSTHGVQIWRNNEFSKLAWLILTDRQILNTKTPLVCVVHGCQVVRQDEDTLNPETHHEDDIQCDYVVTPDEVIHVEGARKANPSHSWLENVGDTLIHAIPPLQELKGIRLMERIMSTASSGLETKTIEPELPAADTQMGIDIVTRLMKGYKP